MRAVAERVWKVSELIRQINVELFRYNDISVEGEATNVVRSAAGHIYFSIKHSRAQMRVVLFATNSRFLRFRIENGLQLVVRGRLTLYEQKASSNSMRSPSSRQVSAHFNSRSSNSRSNSRMKVCSIP